MKILAGLALTLALATHAFAKSLDDQLVEAAGAGNVEKINKLIAAGANPIQSGSFLPPLHRAASEGHTAAIVSLIAGGANPNVLNNDGKTALIRRAVVNPRRHECQRGHEHTARTRGRPQRKRRQAADHRGTLGLLQPRRRRCAGRRGRRPQPGNRPRFVVENLEAAVRVGTTAVDAQIAIGGGMSGGTESQRGRGSLAVIRPPPSSARGRPFHRLSDSLRLCSSNGRGGARFPCPPRLATCRFPGGIARGAGGRNGSGDSDDTSSARTALRPAACTVWEAPAPGASRLPSLLPRA